MAHRRYIESSAAPDGGMAAAYPLLVVVHLGTYVFGRIDTPVMIVFIVLTLICLTEISISTASRSSGVSAEASCYMAKFPREART